MNGQQGRCPNCDGTEFKQITPTFVECLSEVQVGEVPPGAHGNPHPLPVMGPCRHRFQVAAPGGPAAPCFCGRDSIGACIECQRRLCGLHGSDSGDFICADCESARRKAKEEEGTRRFEESVAVVRRTPYLPGCTKEATYDEREGVGGLRARGGGLGFPDLVGFSWTDGRSGSDPGAVEWQIVHHFLRRSRGTRRVQKFLRESWEEQTIYEDRWTAYAFYPEVRRLCEVRMFSQDELSEHWQSLRSRAFGSVFQNLRWAQLVELPAWPQRAEAVVVPVVPGEPLSRQLDTQQAKLGAKSWVGLTWTDGKGLRNRLVDDAMVQARTTGLPPAYRVVVIDKDDDGVTVDREIHAAADVPIYFDTLGRELERTITLAAAEFSWRPEL